MSSSPWRLSVSSCSGRPGARSFHSRCLFQELGAYVESYEEEVDSTREVQDLLVRDDQGNVKYVSNAYIERSVHFISAIFTLFLSFSPSIFFPYLPSFSYYFLLGQCTSNEITGTSIHYIGVLLIRCALSGFWPYDG